MHPSYGMSSRMRLSRHPEVCGRSLAAVHWYKVQQPWTKVWSATPRMSLFANPVDMGVRARSCGNSDAGLQDPLMASAGQTPFALTFTSPSKLSKVPLISIGGPGFVAVQVFVKSFQYGSQDFPGAGSGGGCSCGISGVENEARRT